MNYHLYYKICILILQMIYYHYHLYYNFFTEHVGRAPVNSYI
jgi:hypothetical protein